MFRPNLKLRKVGTIGKFWKKPKKTLWNEIKAVEQRISDGLAQPHVEELAVHVQSMLGDDVPLARIRRSFGYWAGEDPIQLWISQLPGHKAVEHCAIAKGR